MKATLLRFTAGLSATFALVACLAVAGDPPAKSQPDNDAYDFVFLAEARPVLIRMHVRLDGKPVQTAVDSFMKHLFAYLDVNGDGVVSKAEAERAPPLDQILSGGMGRALGGFGPDMGGKKGPAPTAVDLDADGDGKISLAELTAFYMKSGFTPLQLQAESAQGNPLAGAGILGGRRPEPSVEAVAEAIFNLLDTDKDGKLSKAELAAAPEVLLKRDEDDDDMITPMELVPDAKTTVNPLAMAGMAGGGSAGSVKSTKNIVLVPNPGESPPDLVKRLQAFYRPKTDEDADDIKLSRQDIGLDETTFKRLDSNADGVLDATELANFVKRLPDVDLTVHLSYGKLAGPAIELAKTKEVSPLAGMLQLKNGVARLDLGRTRVDMRGVAPAGGGYQMDGFGGILRQQVMAQFKLADKDNKGYLDQTTANARGQLGSLFKAMDRDGDGKVYEHEVIAYFDDMADLQKRAQAACVNLSLVNQSRGIFDLLDVDRDGRLGVREMRGAVKLLDQLDTEKKGFITKADLPRSYQLTVRRGPAAGGGPAGIFVAIYGGGQVTETLPELTAGPLWFRKMDRNRDGDVSRKEFLGTDAQFREIDTDGDGLISAEEADRYDVLMRGKQK